MALDRSFLAHYNIPVASAYGAKPQGISPQFTDVGAPLDITTGLYTMPHPRNITATAGGTGGDIKAIQVTVHGVNVAGAAISEILPVFTVDTPGTVQGNKIFAQVTRVQIPAHDGTGATTSIGWGDKLGLPYKLTHNTVLAAFLNNAREAVAPTVTVSPTAIEGNSVLLSSALADSQPVDVYLIV